MNLGISKKVIFFYLLFISFILPGKSSDLKIINSSDYILSTYKDPQKSFKNKKLSNLSFYKNFLDTNPEIFLADLIEKQEELVIQSDKQSEMNSILFAEGNVSVSYRNKLLKADKLIYDKLNNKISDEGNITLFFGEQIFKISKLEYNFKNETGYL